MKFTMRRFLFFIACLLTASCERESPPRQPAPALPVSETPPPSTVPPSTSPNANRSFRQFGARCALESPTPIADGLGVLHGVGIATGDASQMIVSDRDSDTLLAMSRRVAEGASPVALTLPGADEIFAIEAIDGDRFVVVTHARCPESHETPRCLMARLLGADARALSDAMTIPLPEPLRTFRVDANGDAVWIARTSAQAQPKLDMLFASREGTLSVLTRTLGDRRALDEPTEVLGLAVSGGSFAVLYRRGATEDARSAVVLATPMGEREIESLHDALVLDSFDWSSGSLAAIAAFEFQRPIFLRFGPDGRIRGEQASLSPGDELPAPFMNRRTAIIQGAGPNMSIEVRDGAGDAIAAPVPIENAVHADIARRGDDFVVAIAKRDAGGRFSIETRELRCESAR
jgi:hypothetical protein